MLELRNIGLSLPSSPSQNKNRQKPLDAFFEGKEYENDFESENDLLAPKGKSLDLQIFEYFNKSRILSRNKEIENKNVIDCGSAESGSITAVNKSKIIASNIVEYKKGNYGYNIPKGANGYILDLFTAVIEPDSALPQSITFSLLISLFLLNILDLLKYSKI